MIGSGATAVTLVPAMIDGEGPPEHVTMLQRSPTYMVSRPSEDSHRPMSLRKMVAEQDGLQAHPLAQHAVAAHSSSGARATSPEKVRDFQADAQGPQEELGPESYDIETSFHAQPYNPWEQRLCLVPDSDFFRVINEGKSSIVTDRIERFTDNGLQLKSGNHLDADIIVTATGLDLQMAGGVEVEVDGEPVDFGESITYKAMMFADVPNFAISFGYTNASWTLRADLTCEYVTRLLNHMEATGTEIAVPRLPEDEEIKRLPWVDFSSGYFKRAEHKLPAQGDKGVWRNLQNYPKDVKELKKSPVADEAMEFSKRRDPEGAKAGEEITAIAAE